MGTLWELFALLDKFADSKDVEFEFAKEGKTYVVKSVK